MGMGPRKNLPDGNVRTSMLETGNGAHSKFTVPPVKYPLCSPDLPMETISSF